MKKRLQKIADSVKYVQITISDTILREKTTYNNIRDDLIKIDNTIKEEIEKLAESINKSGTAPEEELESVYIISNLLNDNKKNEAKTFIEKYQEHIKSSNFTYADKDEMKNALDAIKDNIERGAETGESEPLDEDDSEYNFGRSVEKNRRRTNLFDKEDDPDFIKRLKNTLKEQGFFKYDKNSVRYHNEDQIYNPDLSDFNPDSNFSESTYYTKITEKNKENKKLLEEEISKFGVLISNLKNLIDKNKEYENCTERERTVIDRFLKSILKSLQADNLQTLPIDLFNQWKNWIIGSYQTMGDVNPKSSKEEQKKEQFAYSYVKAIVDSVEIWIEQIDWEKIREEKKSESGTTTSSYKIKRLLKKGGF